MNVTRLIESSNFEYWECEECNMAWYLEECTPEEDEINYCPKCGRKIIEYISFKHEDEGEIEC